MVTTIVTTMGATSDDNDGCHCLRQTSVDSANECHKQTLHYRRRHQFNHKYIYLLFILFIHFTIASGVTRPTYLLFANRKDIRLVNSDNQRPNASIIMNHLEEAAAL
ncbi:unnamed protein product, partial [Medioppia subpectinata]